MSSLGALVVTSPALRRLCLGVILAALSLGALVITPPARAAEPPNGDWILRQLDENAYATTRVAVVQMVIHLARTTRTVKAKSWVSGLDKSFTQFLYPERDKGTKLLKLGDELWLYTPATDRTIKLSGSMLRQSVMGSDLSYEDLMEASRLAGRYSATVVGEDTAAGRQCWVLALTAKSGDASYASRRLWVDKERFVPLRENRYAKSGKLLKTTVVSSVRRIGSRWIPDQVSFKDALRTGAGTDFILDSIWLDVPIPAHLFSKAALKQ